MGEARGQITLDELWELLGYTALDPGIWELILLEAVLRNYNLGIELVAAFINSFPS